MQVSYTLDSILHCSWQPDMEFGELFAQFQHLPSTEEENCWTKSEIGNLAIKQLLTAGERQYNKVSE